MCRYFEEEDEEDNMAYQPAPGSPGEEKNEESEEEDPLDAFMADIEVKPENINYLWIVRLSSGSMIANWIFHCFFGLEVRFWIFFKNLNFMDSQHRQYWKGWY